MKSHDSLKQKSENVDMAKEKAQQPHPEPTVGELEAKLAHYCGVKHAIACASRDDALLMALASYGVGSGDAIFTTPFNDAAAVSIIRLLGATPIFVDIDQSTFNLDPEQLAQAIEALRQGDASLYPLPNDGTVRRLIPKGILSVDLFGLPADYDAIGAIADRYGLFVIEDGSQAFGAEYKGRRVGSLADIGCASFSPEVPLGSDGSGGMCFTNKDDLAERMRSIREQGGHEVGAKQKEIPIVAGMDSRQAVSLLTKLENFPNEIKLLQEAAQLYTKYMDENPLLVTPYVPEEVFPVWSRYSLLTESDEDRSNMLKKLKDAGIVADIYCARPLYLQDDYADLQYREGDFPISDDYASRIFNVPLHPQLTAKEQEEIADLLNDWQ